MSLVNRINVALTEAVKPDSPDAPISPSERIIFMLLVGAWAAKYPALANPGPNTVTKGWGQAIALLKYRKVDFADAAASLLDVLKEYKIVGLSALLPYLRAPKQKLGEDPLKFCAVLFLAMTGALKRVAVLNAVLEGPLADQGLPLPMFKKLVQGVDELNADGVQSSALSTIYRRLPGVLRTAFTHLSHSDTEAPRPAATATLPGAKKGKKGVKAPLPPVTSKTPAPIHVGGVPAKAPLIIKAGDVEFKYAYSNKSWMHKWHTPDETGLYLVNPGDLEDWFEADDKKWKGTDIMVDGPVHVVNKDEIKKALLAFPYFHNVKNIHVVSTNYPHEFAAGGMVFEFDGRHGWWTDSEKGRAIVLSNTAYAGPAHAAPAGCTAAKEWEGKYINLEDFLPMQWAYIARDLKNIPFFANAEVIQLTAEKKPAASEVPVNAPPIPSAVTPDGSPDSLAPPPDAEEANLKLKLDSEAPKTVLPPEGLRGPLPKSGKFVGLAPVGLDKEQEAATRDQNNDAIVLAAAGSGKTRTSIARVYHLIAERNTTPERITVMAFNRHAAREVKDRIVAEVGSAAEGVDVRTLHSLAVRSMPPDQIAFLCTDDQTQVRFTSGGQVIRPSEKTPGETKYFAPQGRLATEAVKETRERLINRMKQAGVSEDEIKEYDRRVLRLLTNSSLLRYVGVRKNAKKTILSWLAEWDKNQGDELREAFVLAALLYEQLKGSPARPGEFGHFPLLWEKFNAALTKFPPSPDAKLWQETLEDCNPGRPRPKGAPWVPVERLDFDDVLVRFWQMLRKGTSTTATRLFDKFDHVIVDEAQDMSPVQREALAFLTKKIRSDTTGDKSVWTIGDDSQSIYAFRSADPLSFVARQQQPEVKTLMLSTNYRSVKEVTDAADKLIGLNKVRTNKKTISARGPSKDAAPITVGALPDYPSVAKTLADRLHTQRSAVDLGDYAVLMRSNAELDAFEDEFLLNDVPYFRQGGSPFWLRKNVKVIMGWLVATYAAKGKYVSPDDLVDALCVICNAPRRGLGRETVEKALRGVSTPWEAIDRLTPNDIRGVKSWTASKAVPLIQGLKKDAEAIAATSNTLSEALAAMLDVESGIWVGKKQTLREFLGISETGDPEDTDDESGEGGIDSSGAIGTLNRYIAKNEITDVGELLSTYKTNVEKCKEMKAASDANGGKPPKGAVILSTVHKAKGLEWPHVITVMNEGTFPSKVFPTDYLMVPPGSQNPLSLEDSKLEEERRLAYVAVTRAKDTLEIFSTDVNHLGKGAGSGETAQPLAPSRFIAEMGLSMGAPPPAAEEEPKPQKGRRKVKESADAAVTEALEAEAKEVLL